MRRLLEAYAAARNTRLVRAVDAHKWARDLIAKGWDAFTKPPDLEAPDAD